MLASRPWLDAHLDLAYLALDGRDLTRPVADAARGCISLPALRRAHVQIVFGTIFTEPVDGPADHPYRYRRGDAQGAHAAGLRQLDLYRRLEADGQITIVRREPDLHAGTLPRVVLLMEGADPIRGPQDVPVFRDQGVHLVGLTWARGTRYAGGNRGGGPLTAEGRRLVAALDEAGVVHDASHLSDNAFAELVETARGPVVATHSNCRAITGDDQRHLRNDQIETIGRRGGIVGLNLYSRFLVPDGRATVADCLRHVLHVAGLMGRRDGVGLGSDADGGFEPSQMPRGLDHPERYEALAGALAGAGWSAAEVQGFRGDNWLRLLQRVLPP